MRRRLRWLCWVALGLAACEPSPKAGLTGDSVAVVGASGIAVPTPPASATHGNRGFRSRQRLNEHFAKHGAEFGRISPDQYLALAQQLRDTTVGGDILEIRRADGVVSRFDRTSGAFIAFDPDGTIRTFFRPNDGEAYFQRQAHRSSRP